MRKYFIRLSARFNGLKPGLQKMFTLMAQTLRLMVGVGDYAAYVSHMQQHHPEAAIPSREQWFRRRLDARYGVGKDGSVKRCPC